VEVAAGGWVDRARHVAREDPRACRHALALEIGTLWNGLKGGAVTAPVVCANVSAWKSSCRFLICGSLALAGSESGDGAPQAAKFVAVSLRPGWAALAFLLVIAAGIAASIQEPNPQPDKAANKRTFFEWLRYPVETHPGLRPLRPPNGLLGM